MLQSLIEEMWADAVREEKLKILNDNDDQEETKQDSSQQSVSKH